MEAKTRSINRRMDKEEGVDVQNGILVMKKNKRMAYAAPQFRLEIITQREISQNAKDKCSTISLMLSENS